MKKLFGLAFLPVFLIAIAFISQAKAQGGRETFTGTVLSYGTGLNTRSVTRSFTLDITGQTSQQQIQRYLGILQEGGQDNLLREVDDQNLGRFSVGPNIGVPINFVHESTVNGRRRIFVVFERWTQFAELRGGYRSLDYPFGVIELSIDPKTGRGEGTYIAAARIRWDSRGNNGQPQVEIENFATFPARLLGVVQRGNNRS
jgi:hypothetical protein